MGRRNRKCNECSCKRPYCQSCNYGGALIYSRLCGGKFFLPPFDTYSTAATTSISAWMAAIQAILFEFDYDSLNKPTSHYSYLNYPSFAIEPFESRYSDEIDLELPDFLYERIHPLGTESNFLGTEWRMRVQIATSGIYYEGDSDNESCHRCIVTSIFPITYYTGSGYSTSHTNTLASWDWNAEVPRRTSILAGSILFQFNSAPQYQYCKDATDEWDIATCAWITGLSARLIYAFEMLQYNKINYIPTC